jgi:hypothetical protein
MKYIILMASDAIELSQVVNDFLKTDQNYNKFKLVGGPYSDHKGHYQAVVKKEKQQLNG